MTNTHEDITKTTEVISLLSDFSVTSQSLFPPHNTAGTLWPDGYDHWCLSWCSQRCPLVWGQFNVPMTVSFRQEPVYKGASAEDKPNNDSQTTRTSDLKLQLEVSVSPELFLWTPLTVFV